jgi:hypothetical protein
LNFLVDDGSFFINYFNSETLQTLDGSFAMAQ